ncbi:uncharacterized protein LOC113639096 [Tachysurus fulvidraco]|uniref:uncharacterized protein LOC113639096 n=1 Tax=Tachysurus fulvidraco TaxID=1234273 RepID=UPI000F513C59|nr:uncharacterized protein LOC113639096 [Tachysurus fulvidraco]
MTMSTRSLEESCSILDNESLPDLKPCQKDTFQSQQDLEDIYSISSGSPCPIKDKKQAEVLSNQSLDKPGILAHLTHTSALESIRELVEIEERSEGRSPGDGAVRVKDVCRETCPSTAIRSMALPSEGCGDTLERIALRQDSNTQLDLVDASSSIDDVLVESCNAEDISYIALIPGHQELFRDYSSASNNKKEVAGHQLTPSHTSSGILEVQLNDQFNITPLQDPQEESICPQNAEKFNTVRNESQAEENNLNLEGVDRDICEKEGSVSNQTLIEVLTACEARVEQLEELKSSSIEMSAQLQSARLLVARLHEKVLNLEQECHLKDKELHDLTVNLEKTSEALQTRNSEMAAITEELRRIHLDLEAQKKTAAAGRTVNANGQLTSNAHQRNSSSKVCTLF